MNPIQFGHYSNYAKDKSAWTQYNNTCTNQRTQQPGELPAVLVVFFKDSFETKGVTKEYSVITNKVTPDYFSFYKDHNSGNKEGILKKYCDRAKPQVDEKERLNDYKILSDHNPKNLTPP